MRATNTLDGSLNVIENCYILIRNRYIRMRILPDISDNKSATYSDETGMGRTMPFKSYGHSDNRTINWSAHYVVTRPSDIADYLQEIRWLQSAVYPRNGSSSAIPYAPPYICGLKCGKLLEDYNDNAETLGVLPAVMKSYSLKYDTSVPWDETTLLPYKFDIDMVFEVVYDQSKLPGQDRFLDYIGS